MKMPPARPITRSTRPASSSAASTWRRLDLLVPYRSASSRSLPSLAPGTPALSSATIRRRSSSAGFGTEPPPRELVDPILVDGCLLLGERRCRLGQDLPAIDYQ